MSVGSAGKIRLNITLPATIARELEEMTGPRKRSAFIAEAVRMRIRHIKAEEQKALLVEGYQATRAEGMDITSEFESVDLEGWDED